MFTRTRVAPSLTWGSSTHPRAACKVLVRVPLVRTTASASASWSPRRLSSEGASSSAGLVVSSYPPSQGDAAMMGDYCNRGDCRIPRPHEHTGVFVDSSRDEWWCPSSQRWEMCPGPCPDGREHHPKRTVPIRSEHVVLVSHPLRSVEP